MHGCSGGGGMCGCSQGACMVALGGAHGCFGGGRAWDAMRYGDTINERAVRILLECILVTTKVLIVIRDYNPQLIRLTYFGRNN